MGPRTALRYPWVRWFGVLRAFSDSRSRSPSSHSRFPGFRRLTRDSRIPMHLHRFPMQMHGFPMHGSRCRRMQALRCRCRCFTMQIWHSFRVRRWGPTRRFVIPRCVCFGSCWRSRVLVLVLVHVLVLSGGARRVGRDPPVVTHPRPVHRDPPGGVATYPQLVGATHPARPTRVTRVTF